MKVTPNVNSAGVDKDIRRQLGPIMRTHTEGIGKDMVAKANDLMAGRFNLNRDYERRRHPGSRRAATALDYEIVDSDGESTVDYKVLGGDEVTLRILIMNYGSVDHDIFPNGAWELGGLNPKKVSRSSSARNKIEGGSAGDRLAYPSNTGRGYWRGQPGESVHHPGTNGEHFLEAARDAALIGNL